MVDKPLNWMIYGATGYTGKLIIEESLRRGHRPIIAGRNQSKINSLADRYGLEAKTFDLSDTAALDAAVKAVDLVFHVAGPFIDTAETMMQACIAGKTHYVDITGEAPVFKRCFELSEQAKTAGICLVSGIGFDVIPTDCLMAYLASQVPETETVEVAIAPKARPSPGTAKSALRIIKSGTVDIREDGEITTRALFSIVKQVRFPSETKTIALAPIADVYTGYYSTGANNIRAYIAQPEITAKITAVSVPLIKYMLSSKWLLKQLEKTIDKRVKGPVESYRSVGEAEVWARAENAQGEYREGGLKTGEVYYLTSQLSVRFIENVLAVNPTGSIAPAQLFSMSQLLDIEGISLYDGNQQVVTAYQVAEIERR